MAQDRSAERPWLAAYPPGIPADIDVDSVGTVVDLFDRSVLRFAEREGADLVVMGGYGHSRLREWLFGGVTRDILRTSPLCCLMSH